jgi:hypothetical protein
MALSSHALRYWNHSMQNLPREEPGPLGKLFALLLGAILLVAGLMFSVVLFAVILVVGLLVWGYLWWKTRELRRQMREHPARGQPRGHVIEGEAVVVDEVEIVVNGEKESRR